LRPDDVLVPTPGFIQDLSWPTTKIARHSRVYSSMTVSIWRNRPSRLQVWTRSIGPDMVTAAVLDLHDFRQIERATTELWDFLSLNDMGLHAYLGDQFTRPFCGNDAGSGAKVAVDKQLESLSGSLQFQQTGLEVVLPRVKWGNQIQYDLIHFPTKLKPRTFPATNKFVARSAYQSLAFKMKLRTIH